jgi:hypothetical protein
MGEARSIVDPNRHATGGQRLDATRASARCRLVGDHPNVNSALFGPDQRPNDPGTDRQAVGRDEDLSLRLVDGADRECRAVFFGRKKTAIAASVAVSVQAAPIVVPAKRIAIELGAAPPIELVRQGCGWGWHRGGWRDRWGYWHWEHCIPNW